MEWLRKLFNETGTLVAVISGALIGLIAGIANGLIQRKHGGWPGFFSAIVTGVVVSIIVGLLLQDHIQSEPLRYAVVGLCAVISDDIWAGLKTLGAGVRKDPLGAISRLIDAIRGKGDKS